MGNVTIFTGAWQNYSEVGWKAYTLTLDVRTGGLVISALATFITLVGTRFWAIVAYALHQIRASTKKEDGVHHQHQVIYRNSSSPLGTAWSTFQISWAWRNRARWNIPRFVLAAIPPILCFVGFAAASVLSSKVAAPPTAASEVKLSTRNCGYLDWTVQSDVLGMGPQAASKANDKYRNGASTTARDYARSCYGSKSQSIATCNLYTATSLPYDTDAGAACPFGGNRCLLGERGAFRMQTAWLDSHDHLGINAPKPNRVQYRRTTTCSVLNVTDRITTQASSSGTVYTWHLGYTGSLTKRSNRTFNYNDNTQNLAISYTIQADFAAESDKYPGWIPIPDLQHTDADVSIFYMAQNTVSYADPVDDPFFSAHQQFVISASNSTYYHTDEVASVMACIDQAEIRNPTTGSSTVPSGFQKMRDLIYSIGLNQAQIAVAWRFIIPSENALMFNSVNYLVGALKAQDSVFILISSGLPNNQWQIELQGWFDTALARLQGAIVEYVSKDIEGFAPYANLSVLPGDEWMCENQKIKAVGNYQSFSLMGIEIVAIVGALIILLSFILESIVGFFQKRWGGQGYKQVAWTTDAVLQQQRLAFEQGKAEEWERTDATVPVTKLGNVWTS